jgi:integration host factor subunit alpha
MNQRLPFAGAGWRVALLGAGMSTKTLTRADLTEAVFNAVGLSRNESSQMVEDILEEVCGALSRGETVKLSSFGTFQVRQKSQRVGRNPKTGDEVPIAPRRVLVFRPSHVLKAQINGLDSVGVDEED